MEATMATRRDTVGVRLLILDDLEALLRMSRLRRCGMGIRRAGAGIGVALGVVMPESMIVDDQFIFYFLFFIFYSFHFYSFIF
jgi:hypothetical protein